MGYEISTYQMQYDANNKETDLKRFMFMLHILWRERSSKMSKTSSILRSLSQMIYDGIHVSNVCTKANRILGFLRRNLYTCPKEVKEAAYKGLVRPVLEYSGSVWDPSGVGLQNELEKVQNREARFVTGIYNRNWKHDWHS